MNSYQILSAYYDRFTDDVGYASWIDYFERIFQKENLQPKLILDLACGTGTITARMAERGYDMIGVDASEDMLTQAFSNSLCCEKRPLFIHQRMEQLELYGTVDACLCCLDSINYVTEPSSLEKAFQHVADYLEPDGIFIFDINTPKKFQDIAGKSYVREDGDVYCVWQCVIEDMICKYDFDIFQNIGENCWKRYKELHKERIYTPDYLSGLLYETGFTQVQTYAELSFTPPTEQEQRIFFTARKAKK